MFTLYTDHVICREFHNLGFQAEPGQGGCHAYGMGVPPHKDGQKESMRSSLSCERVSRAAGFNLGVMHVVTCRVAGEAPPCGSALASSDSEPLEWVLILSRLPAHQNETRKTKQRRVLILLLSVMPA